jgi:hypothetical protein
VFLNRSDNTFQGAQVRFPSGTEQGSKRGRGESITEVNVKRARRRRRRRRRRNRRADQETGGHEEERGRRIGGGRGLEGQRGRVNSSSKQTSI